RDPSRILQLQLLASHASPRPLGRDQLPNFLYQRPRWRLGRVSTVRPLSISHGTCPEKSTSSSPEGAQGSPLSAWTLLEGAHSLFLALLPQWPAACSADAFLCLPSRPPRLAQAGSLGETSGRGPIKLCAMR
ncbi:mCG145306, partial [Mus musculus]